MILKLVWWYYIFFKLGLPGNQGEAGQRGIKGLKNTYSFSFFYSSIL